MQDVGTYWLLTRALRRRSCCACGSTPSTSPPAPGATVWLKVTGAHTCYYGSDQTLINRRGAGRDARMKPVNQRAWLLVLPVVLCVAFSAILPLMTVVNYSVQDIISPERRVFVGTEWFKAVMRDDELHGALWRQIGFSLSVLLVEIPLGIALALSMPAQGWSASAVLVVVAISLLIPWNVVGTIWQIYGRTDIGLMGAALDRLGIDYSYTGNATDAWLTVLVMDVWHWTPLVALLCYAGLRAIPDAYYQAASIDGASQVRGVPLHPAAQAARRADDRRAAAFHGQLHDLHRALRADRRRARATRPPS